MIAGVVTGAPAGSSPGRITWFGAPGPDQPQPGPDLARLQPAALFKSQDSGETRDEITALSKHGTRENWQPGPGGQWELLLDQLPPIDSVDSGLVG